MTDNSPFSKKSIETVNSEMGRGLLEEMNLPPQVISFIRQNRKNLQILGAGLVVAILAWTFYGSYAETQRDESAARLAVALQDKEDASRAQALQQIITDYSSTDAALWSRFELGHIDYNSGKLAEAAARYSMVLEDLESESPLRPLVQFSLAQTFEQKGDLDQALVFYLEIAKMPGFAEEGYAGLGRVYEAKNEPAKAREAYENYLAVAQSRSRVSQAELIEDKLLKLKSE